MGKAVIFGNKDVAESEHQKLRSEDYRNKGKDDAILELHNIYEKIQENRINKGSEGFREYSVNQRINQSNRERRFLYG